MNSDFFQFETDFVDNLRCIPMSVRYKLDTCGVKLKLTHWNSFTKEERQQLVDIPCESNSEAKAYREMLQNLVKEKTNSLPGEISVDSNPSWLNTTVIPKEVIDKAAEFAVNLSIEQWQNLTHLQRFALIKLSRSNHENRNFYPALQEFNLC